MRKKEYYNDIISLLKELHKDFPKYTLGQHLSTALDGYDIWSISDKEMLFAFEKYTAELQYDIPHESGEINKIINDGMNIDKLREELFEEEDE